MQLRGSSVESIDWSVGSPMRSLVSGLVEAARRDGSRKKEAAPRQPEADDRTAMQSVGDFAAGFGDLVTFGGTKWVREAIGCSECVDYGSRVYTGGQVTAGVTVIALGGLTAARAAGVQTRIAIHGAHHTFPVVGRAAHIQVNVWRIGVKGSGSALRIPLPWR